ncbi:MAG: VOC family protein [Nocardioidaceae bacterium]
MPETKTTKNRRHVDPAADDREAEVTRLAALGASRLSDHDEWGAVWTVMADPEGNDFCVGRASTAGLETDNFALAAASLASGHRSFSTSRWASGTTAVSSLCR